MKNSKDYKEALDKAHKECGHNAYFGNGFEAGYDFAMSQPKHLFDGVAQVGEVRRFEGELLDVVVGDYDTCEDCCLKDIILCFDGLTGCDINNVKYIKRV